MAMPPQQAQEYYGNLQQAGGMMPSAGGAQQAPATLKNATKKKQSPKQSAPRPSRAKGAGAQKTAVQQQPAQQSNVMPPRFV